MVDVIAIGAGISGAATAYNLALSGVSVILIDRWAPEAMARPEAHLVKLGPLVPAALAAPLDETLPIERFALDRFTGATAPAEALTLHG